MLFGAPAMISRILLALILILCALVTSPVLAEEPKEFTFAVTDVIGLGDLQRDFEAFQNILSEKTGYTFKLFPVTGRTVVAETFRAKKLDFALSGPAEYVIIASKTNATPVIGLHRPDYYSVVLAKKDSGIAKLADLKGKKIAFGDHGSTSYHLAPLQVLRDAGMQPETDFSFVNVSKQVAWKSFVRGKVDAIGMNRDRFLLYSEQEKKFSADDFTILGKSPELPSDLIMAGSHVPQEAIQRVQKAFQDSPTELLDAILVGPRNKKYADMKFVTNIQDSDYDSVRQMFQSAGFSEFAGPRKAAG